jgi:putative transposase
MNINKTRYSVYNLNYHIVWIPKYRKKLFFGQMERRLGEIIRESCIRNDISVLALEVMSDHIHLFVSAPPRLSPSKIVNAIKGFSSMKMRQEFVQLRNIIKDELWTHTYFVGSERIKPNENQKLVAKYAKKIAKKLLNIDITIIFVKCPEAGTVAQFGNNTITFNVSKLNGFFNDPVSAKTTDLILHELGHYAGNHVDKSYHELLTEMAGKLVMLALQEPEFFKLQENSKASALR